MISKKFMLMAIFLLSLLAVSAVSASGDADNLAAAGGDDFDIGTPLDDEILSLENTATAVGDGNFTDGGEEPEVNDGDDNFTDFGDSNFTDFGDSNFTDEGDDEDDTGSVDSWLNSDKIYTDSIEDLVSVSVPNNCDGTISIEVNGDEKGSWVIEHYDEVTDSYYGWKLSDLQINDAGDYTITVKLDGEIINSENITVYEFNYDAKDNGTFMALQKKINDAGKGSTVTLENDYAYDDGFTAGGIFIGKSLTVDGKGHIIDCKNKSRDFSLHGDGIITLKNIIFKNGQSPIYSMSDNMGIINCSFISCSVSSDDPFLASNGIIDVRASNCTISESSFINCSNRIIQVSGSNCTISESSFINCSSQIIQVFGSNCTVSESSFINCSMSSSSHINGGIVYIRGSNSSISESSFINCSMSSSSYINGGIVHIWGSNSSISGSSFINCPIISNSQNEGGVLYLNGYSHQIANSVFKNVRISSVGSLGYIDGGVVLFRGNGINSILNSNFTDCKSTSGLTSPISGGVVSAGYCNITVAGSNFINCSAIVNEGDNLAGGIITISGFSTYFNITQSSFINCYSECTGFEDGSNIIGGVIQSGRTSLNSISKSRFVNCTAQIDSSTYYVSGVIDLSGDENMIADSVFENCNLKGTSSGLSSLLTVDGSSSYSVLDSSFDGCGGYNILIDAKYKNCTINNCPTIKIVDISVKNLNAVYGSGVKCMITVSENYAPAKNVSVVVSINDKKFTTIKTDSKGVASFKISQAPGTYKLTLTASDKSVSKTMTVKKATPKLTANAKSFKKSVKTKKYTVTLKTNSNKVMKNTKVTLKVNGKTYSAKTNSKGQATFKITKLTKKGKYTAVVKYAGSKYYNAKTVNPKITVK
ncbi:hypothetical protein [Methanobrevibacter sp.]|uniref:hypothetical protein n=1 Tax=Methanobrevibacter sp. TaxID=66852 RepID=UPI00386FC382